MKLGCLFSELEEQGLKNDLEISDRSYKQLNITKDTGEFLTFLVKVSNTKTILEVGTSNGYSTLWLAAATADTGRVTTLEIQQHKIDQAKVNFERAGLSEKIEVLGLDAAEFFKQAGDQYDLIFLDAERIEYMSYSKDIISTLRAGGGLVCDNAISHKSEMAEFMRFIKGCNNFVTSLVPVGKGEFVAYKSA